MVMLAERKPLIIPDRTNEWLSQKLEFIWQTFFADVPQTNEIEIRYCRPWKRRLGVIRLLEDGNTFIGINQILRNSHVPETIPLVTIAHELVHYAHGFGSPLPRHYARPHYGNVVDRELIKRGLEDRLRFFDYWTTKEWDPFYSSLPYGKRDTNR